MNNKEHFFKIRKLIKFLIEKIGTSIFSGKSLINISLPVFIFDTQTMLQKQSSS